MNGIDGAGNDTADASGAKDLVQTFLHRISKGVVEVAAGKGFLDQNAFVVSGGVFDHRYFIMVLKVVGDHGHVGVVQAGNAASHGLGGHASGAHQAFLLQVVQGV